MADLTTSQLPDPQVSVDAVLGTAPMGDETPLVFASPTPAPAMPIIPPVMPAAPKPEPMPSVESSYLPPVPPAPISTPAVEAKPKSKSKVMLVVFGIFALLGALGVGGYFVYQQFTTIEPNKIAVVGKDKNSCHGCLNGGWMVWRNGECKITGICDSGIPAKDTENPDANLLNTKDSCESAGNGYVWCSSVDSVGRSYAFCNTKGIGCNQAATEEGYTIIVGAVKCIKDNDQWVGDHANIQYYWNSQNDPSNVNLNAEKEKVNSNCSTRMADGGFGNGKYICKEGVKGSGGVVYSGGPCTLENGKLFTGNLACFCGTIQEDTGAGHTSYTSTCGCSQTTPETHKACNVTTKVCETVTGPGADTCTTDANCVTAAPVLACTGLTQTPATTPAVGDKVTFTCAGSITPAGAATLSYKFRYSLNSGADQLLTNKTATTAELTISACGTYSVQCKVCATIGGVLTCNPTWAGAVQ